MKIRKATSDDLEQLTSIFGEYRFISGYHRDPQEEYNYLKRRLEKADNSVFLCFVDGKLVGFAILSSFFSSYELKELFFLNDIYTTEEMRHQGVAQSLLSEAVFYAKKNHRGSIQLTTTSDNYHAQALFERFGFKKSKEINFEFVISA